MSPGFKFLLALGLTAIATLASARSYEDVIDSGYIEIAVYRDFPPYSYLVDNKPAGIDIEIGKLLASGLGVELRWRWITADESLEDDLRNAVWKGHVLDAQKRVADVMLRVPYDRKFSYAIDGYGLPKNDLVHMFAPYHQEGWALARDLNKTGEVRNLAIFQYEKVGVEIDSLPDTFLGSTLLGRLRDKIVHFSDIFKGIAALESGEVSAVAGMRSQLEWGLSKTAKNIDVSADGLQAMSKKEWDIGLAIKSDYRQLGHALEAVIEQGIADGSIEAIFKQHSVSYDLPSLYD